MPRNPVLRPLLAAVVALAATAYIAPAASADDRRGRGWDNDRGRGGYGYRDDRRGRGGWDRGRHHRGGRDKGHDTRFSFSFGFGSPGYYSHPRPYVVRPYYPRRSTTVIVSPPPYPHPNAYGLAPYQCRIDYRFDRWRGYPAEISLEICADAYGAVYVVQGSQRLVRYR